MMKEENINKIKIIVKIIVIIILILFVLKIFNPDSPREFYFKNKSALNKIIKNIDRSKGNHSKKSFIFGIKNIYYSDSIVYETKLVKIDLKHKPFTPPFYIGLIYSYTGKARIPELQDGDLQEVSDGVWYWEDGTDNYCRLEHIEGNWFTYECGF